MREERRGESYSVPSGRPMRLAELRHRFSAVTDCLTHVGPWSHPLEWDTVADYLYEAFRTAAVLAPEKTPTNCSWHPRGAVDPEAPVGWSRCLLCNDRRRRHFRGTPPPVAPAVKRGDLGYPVPFPPYDRDALLQRTRRLNDVMYDLSIKSSFSEFSTVADLLHEAFCIARELSRPRNQSGCAKHPGGPRDVDESCLLCRARSYRGVPPPASLRRRRMVGGQWCETGEEPLDGTEG